MKNFFLTLVLVLGLSSMSQAADWALTTASSASLSATPTQIGVARWEGNGRISIGAGSCMESLAKYSNGTLSFGLVEICGAVGGSVNDVNGKISVPLTAGINFTAGPLRLHGGYGPDLVGTPVALSAFTYPF